MEMAKLTRIHSGGSRPPLAKARRGLTLTELLIAGTIMTMLAAGMGTLVMTVHAANEFCRGQAVAAQHARVALDRIQRSVRTAEASEHFPGCLVVSQPAGGWEFPDTLVVWKPEGNAADPNGLPRVNELLLFTPDPLAPSRLIELRAPDRTGAAPAASDAAGWAALVDDLKASGSSVKNELTDRLRTGAVTEDGTDLRGCIRFRVQMGPTAGEWAAYRGGTRTWDSLAWPLDQYSTRAGLRRVVCQTELHILPGDSASQSAVPFFGSAALSYELQR